MAAVNGDVARGMMSVEVAKKNNKVTVVLGAQWGDEGKGKVVDLLATDADLVCRCQVPYTYIIIIKILLIRG